MSDDEDGDYEDEDQDEEHEDDQEEEGDDDEEVERVERDGNDYKFDTKVGFHDLYKCQNIGCIGKRYFRHNKEEWFTEKGIDSPVNCKPCGDWKKKQKEIGPMTATCHWCKQTSWQVYPGKRISYLKYHGRWDADFQICYRCKEYPGRKRKVEYGLAQKLARDPFFDEKGKMRVDEILKKITAADEADRKKIDYERSKDQLLSLFEQRGLNTSPLSYVVPDDVAFYDSVKTPSSKVDEHGLTRLTHIMKEKHKWQERFGLEDQEAILEIARHIAISTENHIYQFEGESDAVYKYDVEQQVLVIVEESRRSPTGYMLITSYEMDVDQVIGKIENSKWSGAWNPRAY